MERVIVCHVKVYRTKIVNGIQQYNKALKTYQFWLVEEKPGPLPPEKIEKPDCLAQVDLGLSVNWANCNLGSQTVEGFGGHYAWGDPTGKLWSGQGISLNLETLIYSWGTENYGGIDPPSDIAPKAHGTSPLNAGKRVRVTTNLAPEDYAALKALARRRGLSMSAVVAEAVYTLLRAK